MKKSTTVHLLIIFILFFQSCGPGADKGLSLKTAVMPDSSVNKMLKLLNAEFTPDSIKNAIDSNGIVVLTTNDETKFVIAYQFPGGPKGSFIGFELCGMKSEIIDYPAKKVNTEQFKTTNGIYFGMPENDFLKVKGDKFQKTSDHDDIATYVYTEAPEDFLQRHNSQQYIFECEMSLKKVSRIRFGFLPEVVDSTSDRRLKKVNEP